MSCPICGKEIYVNGFIDFGISKEPCSVECKEEHETRLAWEEIDKREVIKMEKKTDWSTAREAVNRLVEQIATARENKQQVVVEELTKKANRIERRAKKGGTW